MLSEEIPWAIETSKDGERWRFFGKAWTRPGEPLLLHAAPRFLRYRCLEGAHDWSAPLERSGEEPMTLVDLDAGTRQDLWPDEQHAGLPVLLPGGEEGRLLRFEHSPDEDRWTWALEFRGLRRPE
jgi:hypothetical protein